MNETKNLNDVELPANKVIVLSFRHPSNVFGTRIMRVARSHSGANKIRTRLLSEGWEELSGDITELVD